jgi:TIR domain
MSKPLFWVFVGVGMILIGTIGIVVASLGNLSSAPFFGVLLLSAPFFDVLLLGGIVLSLGSLVWYGVSTNPRKTTLMQQGQEQRSATPLQAPTQEEVANETKPASQPSPTAQSSSDKLSMVPPAEKKISLSQQQRVQNTSPPKDLSQPTLSIFVSHSSKDDDFGQKLVHDLRKAFPNEEAIWYDSEGGLYGGDPWWSRIVSSLEACDVFVIVLSPNSVKSKWVMRELDIAMVEGKRIVPILYHQCDIRPDLKAIQIISFLEPISYEAAFNRLLQALRH